jgi:hypothetical protein
MSVITPDSYIKLVRFDVTKEHQITFSDGVAQVNFFRDQIPGLVLQASSYQRQNYKIRFPAVIDEIEKYNYLVVQNLPYNYKYYFYYITDMEYINDEMTEITIKLDVFQTYMFDFHYLKSFIEREHTNNDYVGSNTIPEGIEKGEYIINKTEVIEDLDRIIYVVQAGKDLEGSVWLSTNLGGVRGKGCFYGCRTYNDVADFITYYANDPLKYNLTVEDIETIYMIPYSFTNFNVVDVDDSWIVQIGKIFGVMLSPNQFEYTISKPSSIDGYIPRNKKLLTKEFNYLVLSNYCSATEDLYYENFRNYYDPDVCEFRISGMPVIGGSGEIRPLDYGLGNRGDEGDSYELYSLPAGKYPIIDQYFDSYKIWLSNNMFNITTGALESGIESIAGAIQLGVGAYGGSGEGISSGIGRSMSVLGYAYNLAKEMHNKKRIPPATISHSANGDIRIGLGRTGFSFSQMSIKREYAEIIDQFFDKFGYKVLKTKVPNITGRRSWNYVKTIEANIDSTTVPEKYINEFKEMLNSGITFWHNPATFMDYSQNNSII